MRKLPRNPASRGQDGNFLMSRDLHRLGPPANVAGWRRRATQSAAEDDLIAAGPNSDRGHLAPGLLFDERNVVLGSLR